MDFKKQTLRDILGIVEDIKNWLNNRYFYIKVEQHGWQNGIEIVWEKVS